MVKKNNDPQIKSIYIPGVGSADDPLDTKNSGEVEKFLEIALGKDMQEKILRGYEFVARNQWGQKSMEINGGINGINGVRLHRLGRWRHIP